MIDERDILTFLSQTLGTPLLDESEFPEPCKLD